MKESFSLKITPRNLYWSTTGISDSSRFNVRLLCIILNWQKYAQFFFFVLENLKPFMNAHLFILSMPCYSRRSAVSIYLDVEVMQKSSTNKYFWTPAVRQLVILLIFMLKRVTDSILHWGTPASWFWMFDRVEPMRTKNFLSERKALIKFGSLPFNRMLCRSFMIYLQVVSYAFSRSKNIATRYCFCIIASRMEVSNLTTWSIVDLRLLKPHWKLVKKIIGLYEPKKPFIYHSLHGLT